MIAGILEGASDYERLTRARQRIDEYKTRFPTNESVKVEHPLIYAGLRQKRREALSMHAELTLMHERLMQDDFGAKLSELGHVPKEGDAPSPQAFASKATVAQMLREIEKSPLYIDNGKAVLEARPASSGLSAKVLDGILDASCKVQIYCRRHPLRASVIALATLAAKLLFVYVVWKAISEPIKAMFGMNKHKKDDDDAVAARSSKHKGAGPQRHDDASVAQQNTATPPVGALSPPTTTAAVTMPAGTASYLSAA